MVVLGLRLKPGGVFPGRYLSPKCSANCILPRAPLSPCIFLRNLDLTIKQITMSLPPLRISPMQNRTVRMVIMVFPSTGSNPQMKETTVLGSTCRHRRFGRCRACALNHEVSHFRERKYHPKQAWFHFSWLVAGSGTSLFTGINRLSHRHIH